MQIGCHVSISGSIDKSVDNAVKRDCSAFQIFTRNPRGWQQKDYLMKNINRGYPIFQIELVLLPRLPDQLFMIL